MDDTQKSHNTHGKNALELLIKNLGARSGGGGAATLFIERLNQERRRRGAARRWRGNRAGG